MPYVKPIRETEAERLKAASKKKSEAAKRGWVTRRSTPPITEKTSNDGEAYFFSQDGFAKVVHGFFPGINAATFELLLRLLVHRSFQTEAHDWISPLSLAS